MHNKESQISLPTLKKKTLSRTIQRPISTYPTALGLLAGAWILGVGFSPIGLSLCIGGLGVGVVGWAYEHVVRGNVHALEIVNEYRDKLMNQRMESIQRLEHDLSETANKDALDQLKLLTTKFESFQTILDRQLSSTELTYNRYLAMAEQVFLNSLDNLVQFVLIMQSISAIDINRLNEKISGGDDGESLKARKILWENNSEKCQKLLEKNEDAMTQLDHVASRLATIKTRDGRALVDMEAAMSELQILIDRVEKYARKN